eukprot:TRINITY_DN44427_c0_g1_i1.p1 TRINITY_DN44427_c0_g1~~TRINITY_DN44427_c0_g1_i1.p1  ORF type:complete len:592 (+),score=191.77 TRINITY_DN44427_c0_g1_i1:73-1776(+)
MPWQLVSLIAGEDAKDAIVVLPLEGDASVGRRPHNTVVCRDLAVSGTHCILHCRRNQPPEFEDCSTNGSFVNDVRLQKGQRRQLACGDVLSLTKPADGTEVEPPKRIQYRIQEVLEDDGGDIPPTAPEPRLLAVPSAARAGAQSVSDHCFAQDLLVQEQQSKAKLTSDLLVSQRKLETEQQAAENMTRELRKVRQQVEEERAKRQETEEGRDRLIGELEALRSESRQLQELSLTHDELRSKHEAVEADIRERTQQCEDLEVQQAQLRRDLAAASEAQQKASQQLAELQIRTRQAQEKAERLQQQASDAKREAERAQEDTRRIQQELESEVASRTELEEQVANDKDQVSKAEVQERAAREELDAATARRADLECQAAAAQSDADSARIAARQVQQRLSSSRSLGDQLKEAGQGLTAELRRRLDLWDKVLLSGLPAGLSMLEEAISGSDVVPTFAQATCRVEDGPTKSQHGDTQEEEPAAGKEQAPAAEQKTAAAEVKQPESISSGIPERLPSSAAAEKAGIAAVTSPSNHAGVGVAAAGGCSTNWSLELVDLDEPAMPAKKKPKRGGS